jgi:hypothetical protein
MDICGMSNTVGDQVPGIVERALVRRVNRYRIRARLSLTEEGRIKVAFTMPGGFLWRKVLQQNDNHCLLRAFDRMLVEGNPNSGKIGTLLLFDPIRGGMKCLASFAVTDWTGGEGILRGHRFVLFPSWKSLSNMVVFVDTHGQNNIFDAHHITFESNSDGSLNCHATSPDRRNRYVICRRMVEEGGSVILGQALVQNQLALDSAGRVTKMISWPSNPEKMIEIWGPSLRRNFADRHPMLTPPDLTNKNDYGVVLAKLRLGNKPPKPGIDERLPACCFSTVPSKATSAEVRRRDYCIKIYSDLFLSVSLLRVDGKLKSDSVWAFEHG